MLTFELPSRLDAANAATVEEQILATISTNQPDVLICDFSQTTYISSAGLRVVLMAAKKMRQNGGSLQLHHLQDSVADVFKLAGMHTILDIRE